ncbi:MAG: DUF4367 domain-containing protein [Chloroflexota bacterium]|nr:DUF4367 domain-containing protein [Chloroflexota bacterium]
MNYTNYGILAVLLLFVIATVYMTRAGTDAREEFFAANPPQDHSETGPASGPFHEEMSLASARDAVPFYIMTPSYLPEGYEPLQKVFVQKELTDTSRVKGVFLQYQKEGADNASREAPSILIKQNAGTKAEMSIMNSLERPPVDVGGIEAEASLSSGGTFNLIWDDPGRRVYVWVESRISPEELIKVARSLQ